MIRLIFLLRRKPDLSFDAFQRYWREEHGPLVASFAQKLNMLRYVQVHSVSGSLDGQPYGTRGQMEPGYDGVAEVWWESEEAFSSGDGALGRRLVDDEREFIDLARSPLWLAHEYPQVNPSPEDIVARPNSSIIKAYYPIRPLSRMKLEDAQLYWRTGHGPLIRRHAATSGILRYQQVHRFENRFEAGLREARGTLTEPYMGHAEIWFDGGQSRSGPELDEASRVAEEDERKFIDFARSSMWFGKEHVFVDHL